jgi:HK97 family phage major capsid protein
MKIGELRKKRTELVTLARKMVDKAESEDRELTAEEEETYNGLIEDIDGFRKKIEKQEKLESLEKELAESQGTEGATTEIVKESDQSKNGRASKEYREAFSRYLTYGLNGLREAEYRALQSDIDISGGYVVAPEQMVQELIKSVDDMVFIRGLSTVISVPQAQSLGAPSLDADPADADWTSELATGSEDSAMAFGKRNLNPHPLAKRIKMSNDLLRASFMNVETLVRERLAYKFAITEEKAFMTGTGAGQPLGIFTASANGISTGRDVSTGNTTTSIQFDGLIEAKYTLKGQYWGSAVWVFHRDALKQITKLKDGDGQYIWRQSVREGEPDSLLGRPFNMSEYCPNTFTTGKYVGMLADFRSYWIADALDMTVQRLIELYAETNQVGLIGRMKMDAMPVLEEAFIRVKLA